MADLPIPFSAPMVQALLREIAEPGTGKTETRRLIEPYEAVPHPFKANKTAPPDLIIVRVPARLGGFLAGPAFRPRYRVGDRLYVREHWRCEARFDDTAPRDLTAGIPIYFAADPNPRDSEPGCAGRFRQGMHMPRWASRITLDVTEVRVERLQDISEADAVAEGIEYELTTSAGRFYRNYQNPPCPMLPYGSYRSLWDSINGPGSWDANPWVAAYSFVPRLGNIDAVAS